MGYFALINNENVVEEIISISNETLGEPTLSFPQTENAGQAFIANTLNLDGVWKQTSINGKFRGTYAGIGYTYDIDLDEFLPPVTV
jgi:hypothetical protein